MFDWFRRYGAVVNTRISVLPGRVLRPWWLWFSGFGMGAGACFLGFGHWWAGLIMLGIAAWMAWPLRVVQ